MSSSGMMPPPKTAMSPPPACRCMRSRIAGKSVMCAPDRIESPIASTSSWMRRLGDHLGRLVQAGVDHLEAGVAQRARDDLGAAVVPVEPGLGDEDAERRALIASDQAGRGTRRRPRGRRRRSRRRVHARLHRGDQIGGMRFSPLSQRVADARERARAPSAPLRARFTRRTRSACCSSTSAVNRAGARVGALLRHLVAVHADHHLLAAVELLLVAIGRLGDLLLRDSRARSRG